MKTSSTYLVYSKSGYQPKFLYKKVGSFRNFRLKVIISFIWSMWV